MLCAMRSEPADGSSPLSARQVLLLGLLAVSACSKLATHVVEGANPRASGAHYTQVAAPTAAPARPPLLAQPSAAPAPAQSATISSSASAGRLPPLVSAEPIVELPLEDGRKAIVSLPLGSTSPRLLLVATHGAGGRAIDHCRLWRRIVADRGFVLCPRGRAIYPYGPAEPRRFFYPGHPSLAKAVTVAMAALARRYAARLDPNEPIFAGYSQGASMGSMVLPTHPAHFARAALIEGGFGQYQEWNIATARRFHAQGASRVLLGCGRAKCARLARVTASYMRQGGLEVRLVYAVGAGHTYAGPMEKKVGQAFGWLTEGDARWGK